MDGEGNPIKVAAAIETNHGEQDLKPSIVEHVIQEHAAIYLEALQRYPDDESIDKNDERRLKRKLDARILPLLGVCYFFYVSLSEGCGRYGLIGIF